MCIRHKWVDLLKSPTKICIRRQIWSNSLCVVKINVHASRRWKSIKENTTLHYAENNAHTYFFISFECLDWVRNVLGNVYISRGRNKWIFLNLFSLLKPFCIFRSANLFDWFFHYHCLCSHVLHIYIVRYCFNGARKGEDISVATICYHVIFDRSKSIKSLSI